MKLRKFPFQEGEQMNCKAVKSNQKVMIEIELEKLELISDYYDIPLSVFFSPIEELKKLKGKKWPLEIKKKLAKLEKVKEIVEEE